MEERVKWKQQNLDQGGSCGETTKSKPCGPECKSHHRNFPKLGAALCAPETFISSGMKQYLTCSKGKCNSFFFRDNGKERTVKSTKLPPHD